MEFDSTNYGPEVARILALDGNGNRLLPLRCEACSSEEARNLLKTSSSATLFPGKPRPEAPMAGLWLYFSCHEEAHQLADSCDNADGNLWHGIFHRIEGDFGNAAYWFRKAGKHPIFADLAAIASGITKRLPNAEFRTGRWDPFAFLSFCERALTQPGTEQERAAMEIQRAEWQLLFDHCARPQ
jgi:hypothetical protein